MGEETIEVEVKIVKTVDVEVEISTVINAINELPIAKRWNHVAAILNHVKLSKSELKKIQRMTVLNFLQRHLTEFNN